MQNLQSQKIWAAVDLGGTRLRLLALRPSANDLSKPVSAGSHVLKIAHRANVKPFAEILARVEKPSPFGLDKLILALKVGLDELRFILKKQDLILENTLLMASPGRFYTDSQGRQRMAARTAVHLEKFPGEFSDLDIIRRLSQGLAIPEEQIFVDNDAVVQGLYLIHEILSSPLRSTLLAEPLVCINPGTGLGGCVARVDRRGQVKTFSDGHISEFMLGAWNGAEAWSFSQKITSMQLSVTTKTIEQTVTYAGHEQIFTHWPALEFALKLQDSGGPAPALVRLWTSPQGKQAEDCLSGSGLAEIAQVVDNIIKFQIKSRPLALAAQRLGFDRVDGRLLSAMLEQGQGQVDNEDLAYALAQWIADFAGAALSRLIDLLCEANLHKGPGFPDWSAQDLRELQGLRRFIFGGGISQTSLGQWIMAAAQEIQDKKQSQRQFLHAHSQDDAGALGCLFMLPNKS